MGDSKEAKRFAEMMARFILKHEQEIEKNIKEIKLQKSA